MHSMHGLFLTCSQGSRLYSCNVQSSIYIDKNTTIVNLTPCRKNKSPTYLGGQCLAHGGKSPSNLLATSPPFDSYPLHPFPPPQPHYTVYNDDIINTAFFVLDMYILSTLSPDVTADGSLGGRFVWVEMSLGSFTGERIIKALHLTNSQRDTEETHAIQLDAFIESYLNVFNNCSW
jgi:hypothetical protein